MNKFRNIFLNKMEKYGKRYDKEDEENFEYLYQTLQDNNVEGVKVFSFGMGEGKSTFIQEYCKYKMEKESNFACAIVNRTINECIDTCISLELKDEYKEEFKDFTKEQLYYLYRGKLYYGHYDKEPNLQYFNAITVSGFNQIDCPIYSNHLKYIVPKPKDPEKLEKYFEDEQELEEFSLPIDNSLCFYCEQQCLKRKSKELAKIRQTILISHSRLFNSNDYKAMLDGVLYYKNENAEIIDRTLLIIDEKLTMADIAVVKMADILTLKEYMEKIGTKEECNAIQAFINILDTFGKPINSKDMITKEIKDTFPEFILSDETKRAFFKKPKCVRETIQKLETLHKYEFCVISQTYMARKKQKEKREFTLARYIDLLEYTKAFKKVVLLDGTADLDFEYRKSKIKLESQIKRKKRKINLFIPYNPCNLSKSTIQNHIHNRKSEIVKKMAKECDNIIETTKEKTLIVTYMSAFKHDDFKTTLKQYIKSAESTYEVIHFGQYTTGVNFLSDYKNIIFLGQLRKPPAYYKAKSLILSDDKNKYSIVDIKYNEMLIDTIQQIGRTCYRKNEIPNVYIFDNEEITNFLKDNLSNYFDTIEQDYYNEYLYAERKEYNKLGKKDENTYRKKLLEYIYTFLKEEENNNNWIDSQYVFKVAEIKQAIGYMSKNFGRVIQGIKKLTTNDFIIHDYRGKTITINLEELVKKN